MKIKKIQLKDYKRFHDLTIDLGNTPKRIVALIGPNGCGKSSVFDAMIYFARSNGANVGSYKDLGYLYHSLKGDVNFSNQINESIKIEFENGDFYKIYSEKWAIGKASTVFSFRSPLRYNAELMVRESKSMNKLSSNDFGASSTSLLDQKMEQNYRRLYIKYNEYLNNEDSRPSEAKKHIIGELNNSIKNCLDLEIDNLGSIDANEGTLYFRKNDYYKPFSFNVLSAGEKEVIDILLDLYLRKDEFNDTIFIIDEPELHLNTSIQRKLLIEINKLVGKNCQIWIATHSIGFMRALQEDLKKETQVILFDENNQWASKPYVLTPINTNREQWKSIFSTALDDLTNLIAPKRIVYCEGRDKPDSNNLECGFDAKVFNIIFSEKYNDTLFVSSGGNTELDKRSTIALTILNKVFKDIEIWVLKDRDMASGKQTDEIDRRTYLNTNPNNHRVLKRWEIENYIFDKEVLKKYCSVKSLEFDEIEYDKLVTEICDDNLKDVTGRIKNICNIKNSINHEVFKLELAKHITSDMKVFTELEEVIFNRE